MSAGWAKLHNDLWSSRKWMSISLAAQGLWTTAVAYSNTMRTYGKLEGHLLPLFRGTPELAAELVDAGLWDVDGDGWQIHDWDDHQTSREHAESVSAKRAAAGRKGGQKSRLKRQPDSTETPLTSDSKQSAKQTEATPSKPKQEEEEEEEQEEQLSPLPPQGGELLLSPEPPRKRSGARVYPDAFEVLWSVWPKTGDTKRTAYTAWEKATRGSSRIGPRISESELLEAVKRFAADPNLPGPAENRFIPALSVWINQDRWENGPLPPRGGPGGGRPDPLSQGLATAARLRAEREAREQQTRPQYPHLTNRRTA